MMADERQKPKPRILTIMGWIAQVEEWKMRDTNPWQEEREDRMEGQHVTCAPLEGRLLICRTELMIGESGA
jgi:hypothetical protein